MPTDDTSVQTARPKRALFIGAIFIVMAGLAEIAARAVDAATHVSVTELRDVYQERRAWRLGHSWPIQRGDYPYLPYVPNPEHSEVNELGFRGESFSREKAPDSYRVICLGGSTTWNGYPAHLQDALRDDFARRGLRLEVINGGNQCWTSMDSLVSFITRCLPLKPDAIVTYHAINDAVIGFGKTMSWDYSHVRLRFDRDLPLVWDHLPEFLDRSAAYVGFRAIFERKVGTHGIPINIARNPGEHDLFTYHGVEPFRQNIFTLLSVARARGVEVFLCTQVFNGEYERLPDRLRKQWGKGVDDANDITRTFADRWDDVHVIDAAAALPGDNDWMTDYVHFTPQGKVTLAGFIADGIRPHVKQLLARRNDTFDVSAMVPPSRSLASTCAPLRSAQDDHTQQQ